MALVRVYCGISSVVPTTDGSNAVEDLAGRLTAAIVDDSGRLLEYCEINDDPAGYALVTALLAERFGGSTMVAVAVDSDDHLVNSLLAAAGRAIAYTDDETADDFAERFADDDSIDELQAGQPERRAVGLARALQAGALSPSFGSVAREFAALKPVLAAHSALAVGRHAAAVALREVLRELYPAALRAYPDPAEPVALAVLDQVAEPGMLSSGGTSRRDSLSIDTITARLVADGVCDGPTANEAVTSLRVAIAETPRRGGVGKGLVPAVAATVRAAVASVRSADAAIAALIGALVDRVAPSSVSPQAVVPRRTSITITSAPPAQGSTGRTRQQPTPVSNVLQQPRPVAPPPVAPQPVARPAWSPVSAPQVPPGFEPTPLTGVPMVAPAAPAPVPVAKAPRTQRSAPVTAPASPIPAQRAPRGPAPADTGAPFVPTLTQAAISSQRGRGPASNGPADSVSPAGPVSAGNPAPPAPEELPGSSAPLLDLDYQVKPARPTSPPPVEFTPSLLLDPPTSFDPAPSYEQPPAQRPASRSPIDPLVAMPAPIPSTDPLAQPASATSTNLTGPPGSRANWPLIGDTEDQARTPERVTPPWQADDLVLPEAPPLRLVEPAPAPAPMPRRTVRDELDGPPLRLIDEGRQTKVKPRRTERSEPIAPPPDDDDLLIFASVSSAWFSDEAEEPTWNSQNDLGWHAAEQAARAAEAARPTVDDNGGLPRRVPQANLVPGSPLAAPERPLRIVRDAADIATHTSNYFRGWRRGNQEVGGFALGGRPGRESANGWDFSREHDLHDDRDDHGYRAANYR